MRRQLLVVLLLDELDAEIGARLDVAKCVMTQGGNHDYTKNDIPNVEGHGGSGRTVSCGPAIIGSGSTANWPAGPDWARGQ